MFPDVTVPGTLAALGHVGVGVTFLVLGIVAVGALYVRHKDTLGAVGTAGLLSIGGGTVLGIGITVGMVTGGLAIVNTLLVIGGAGLLAVSLRRISDTPKSAAYLLGLSFIAFAAVLALASGPGVAPVVDFALAVVSLGAFSVAWVILGVHLWRDTPTRDTAAVPAEFLQRY